MFKLFQPWHRSILAIDINSSAVNLLQISKAGDHPCVEAYGHELLSASASDGYIINDVEAVAQCIKKLLGKSHLARQPVVLAVPDEAVISKIVQVKEVFNDNQMEELVILEANKHIPYPIDKINLDFNVVGRSEKNSAFLDVLIVASRAENINCRVEAIARAGLEARVIDVESYAIERAAQHVLKHLIIKGQDKIIAMIEIDTHYTHLFILHGLKMIFSRKEKLGGMQLTASIAEHYNIAHTPFLIAKEVRTATIDYGIDLLSSFKEMVLLQLKRNFQIFYSTSEHESLDHVFLTGGLAKHPGLADLIQEQMLVSTSIVCPLSTMSISKKVNLEAINNEAPSLMVVCGLALRSIE